MRIDRLKMSALLELPKAFSAKTEEKVTIKIQISL